jgi:ParB-like partition proteins
MSEKIQEIKISDITPNPYQPRKTFNQEKIQELADSIKNNGLLQPIILRKSDLLGYELLAGERRLRAAKLAGMTHIPAIVRQMNDQEMLFLSIIENLQREDMSPIEEAKSYQNIINKTNCSHDELAKELGKSRSYISNMLRLLKLPQPILDLLEAKEISTGHARALLSIDNPDEQIKLAQDIQKNNISVRQIEKINKKQPIVKKNTDIFIEEAEINLAKIFGTQVAIQKNTKNKGKIQINFSNLEELNRILNSLK